MNREQVVASNPIAEFVRSCGHELKRAGQNFVTNGCPVTQHKSGHRPVMIYPETQSWTCHDCKRGGSVIDWLMIEKNITAADAMQMLSGGNNGSSEIVATYDYTDETGKLLYQCVRFQPKGFRQRQPDGKGGWIWTLEGVCRVLYRLPELLDGLKGGLPVILVEGEKDCDAIYELGFPAVATCNPMGAGKWRDEYSDALRGATVFVIADKDEPGRVHAQQVAASLHGKAKRVSVIELPDRDGHNVKDVSDWLAGGGNIGEVSELCDAAPDWAPLNNSEIFGEVARKLIEFKTPLQLKNFTPPPGIVLVGDCHIVRGSVFVIGGPPGVGKSRASVALAVAGATSFEWFGLTVHRQFKTMIIQTENGPFRLSKEFTELNCDALESYVRICLPPPFGLCLGREDFRAQLAAAIRDFSPDVIVLDPWNAAARDEKARDYLDTFESIRSVLPTGDDAPAIGIVAHTRKPRADERATGRGLLNLLAGSYVLGSVPRTVFVMQAASDDTEDNRVVWTCCKNNDGELGARSAWERRNGLFAPVSEFDWETFDNPQKDDRVTITAGDLAEIFGNGEKELTKAEAVRALLAQTNAGRTACYNALRLDGRFAKHLSDHNGSLSFKL